MDRRVVITGMSVFTSSGKTLDEYFEALKNGNSGIGMIERIDASTFPVQIAGEIRDYNPDDYFDKKDHKKMDLFTQYLMIAADEAHKDAGLDSETLDKEMTGVITGSGIGGMTVFEDQVKAFVSRGPKRVSPFFIPMLIPDIPAGRIAMKYGYRGPNYSVTSACATSTHAIGDAFFAIQRGDADVVVSGGAEAPITNMGVLGFANMKATSRRNDAPQKASRPFDIDRDGFVMGEGAGCLILEEYEHAKKRGARIHAEIIGVGFSCDAYHITQPLPDGDGARLAMQKAIKAAGINKEDIDYINTHGTSTPLGDIAETTAIKNLFGDHAKDLAVNSTKSITGHLLGAAGAVEIIASVLFMKNNVVGPTINLDNIDPQCEGLNLVPNNYIEKEINYALSNNFGFGGHNASIVLKK